MAANIHEDFSRKEQVQGSSDRSFGLLFAVVFVAFALLPMLHGKPMRLWCLLVAAGFGLLAWWLPKALHPLNRAWMQLALLLSRVMNPVMMAAAYYLVITPFAMVFRLLGKDPLRLRKATGVSSYWIERNPPGPAPDSMSNQF